MEKAHFACSNRVITVTERPASLL